MRFFAGISRKKIAALLGISEADINKRQKLALSWLRQALDSLDP
jgi:DNA-directed RNA polymerase specialized sigma subunit